MSGARSSTRITDAQMEREMETSAPNLPSPLRGRRFLMRRAAPTILAALAGLSLAGAGSLWGSGSLSTTAGASGQTGPAAPPTPPPPSAGS